ncbi:MAG: DUF1015 domain-containing protein [Actinobacteria bacterium]|nr:DUF1015 domain-containing protein [Actinomycetota bacterium]
MPRFEPFDAVHFAGVTDVTEHTSPPYDVFGEIERDQFATASPHNIVLVDYPMERDGPSRYQSAASTLAAWARSGVTVRDSVPSLTIYRMTFRDEAGHGRTVSGVIGALEVVDEGAGGVLPHEQTTPKAKSDRLDLTRATRHNLSPVWGLSLTSGLSALLVEPGRVYATATADAVQHVAEAVTDPVRISAICGAVSSSPVLIADGHHRYAISRAYRDEMRAAGLPGSETTMTFVQELVEDQLSVAAIHRIYDLSHDELLAALGTRYHEIGDVVVGPSTIADMDERGCICLVGPGGHGVLLAERDGAFDGVRALDSARLEWTLSTTEHVVAYQHGVGHVLTALAEGRAKSAVLIRPVSLGEIRRTADTGDLMPPKSTFFTPKLRTGMVLRPLD